MMLAMAACMNVHGQTESKFRYRIGASVSFGITRIAGNNVGVGGLAAVEKAFAKSLAGELEVSYTYFTGDKDLYMNGKNKAWALPVLAGVKWYAERWLYGAVRTGIVSFLLNTENATHTSLAYGLAAGMSFSQKINRLNIQLGYTGFHFGGSSRGYATLAAAIIIN
jgi:hypothetical protein